MKRSLARSANGRVIHRATCRHARVPWLVADTLSDDELWENENGVGIQGL